MTIKTVITQLCNVCGNERNLEKNDSHELGGWRSLGTNKHICPRCIEKITTKS